MRGTNGTNGINGVNGLSPLDLKILHHIRYNGMCSTRELSNKLRISPSTIDYKLRKMEETDVITGYKYRIDYRTLGFNKLAWVFIRLHRHGADLKDIVSILFKTHHVQKAMLIAGEFDMVLKVYGRDIEDISNFVFRIKSELKGTVRRVETVFALKTYKLHQIPIGEVKKPANLNKSELKILEYLLENPKARIKEIARDLKLHRNTASSKLKMLHDRKIIVKLTPLLNPQYHYQLGVSINSVMFIDAVSGCVEKLAEKLMENDMVHELIASNNEHDLMAVLRNRDLQELSDFTVVLYSDPSYKGIVDYTNTMTLLGTLSDRSDEPACLKGLRKR